MKLVLAFVATTLLVPATALADDDVTTTSYRRYTLTADGLGLAMLVAAGFVEGEGGRDTDASNTLFAVGGLTSMLATPIIHGTRGHAERAVGSLLMRGGLAGLGMVIAVSANSDCGSDEPVPPGQLFGDDFLCELDYIGYGMLGGLVVASLIDAATMTDERVEPPTWSPQVAASRDGVRAGVAFTW